MNPARILKKEPFFCDVFRKLSKYYLEYFEPDILGQLFHDIRLFLFWERGMIMTESLKGHWHRVARLQKRIIPKGRYMPTHQKRQREKM